MNADMERKQQLESAMKEYFDQAEKHPSTGSWELVGAGEHVWVFGLASFTEQDDPESYYFLAPKQAEQKLMDAVESLFDARIRPATARRELGLAIYLISRDRPFTFPFETHEQEQEFLDEVYKQIDFHYRTQYDAIVPLYQIECEIGVEFPLANAVLYAGGKDSRLANITGHESLYFQEPDKDMMRDCSFLRFPVTGDNTSRLEQVEMEVGRALQVLRFIYPWSRNGQGSTNHAHGVSMRKLSNRAIVYLDNSTKEQNVQGYSDIPNEIFGQRPVSNALLHDAKEFYGLDDINYHFLRLDFNEVSQRIARALSFYDTAVLAVDNDVSLSNCVVSVDILLPSGKALELTDYLEVLIAHVKYYVGKMKSDGESESGETAAWPERVKLTTADFKRYYIVRSQILHGNNQSSYSLSDADLKHVREIAHNAIRAYAYLARAFDWKCDKEAHNWFKSPHSPPKEANT